jgi:hypothetical protein
MRRHRWAGRLIALVATVLVAAPALAAPRDGTNVRHLAAETVAESGESRVIHFAVAPDPDRDRTLAAVVSDPDVLEIIRPPIVLRSRGLGAVRVRGRRPGTTDLTVGDGVLRVRVVEPRVVDLDALDAPRIVGPVTGAAVWGRVAVGIEMRVRPGRPLRQVMVYVGDWMALVPQEDTGTTHLPYRQLRCTLDTASLPEGVHALQAVATDAHGREHEGPPVHIRVVRPSDDRIRAGEAEWRYEIEGAAPFRGDGNIAVERDPEASGGMFVDNAAPVPAVAFPLTVSQPGWYQVMIVGRGTRAQGALPLVAVVGSRADEPLTNARLLSESWHRIAVGIPFHLDAGRHAISPYFGNDFSVPDLADRDLHLDSIEVARVGYASLGVDRPVEDPFGLAAAPLRIGFTRPLHGSLVTGFLEVEGEVWWTGAGSEPVPVVTALLNGVPVGEQRSRAPRFWIDPAGLEVGPNRVQLVARSDRGPEATTSVVEVHRAPFDSEPSPRAMHRFTVHDDRWSPIVGDLLQADPGAAEGRGAAFRERRAVVLELPDALAGEWDVLLEARGRHGAEPAAVSVLVFAGTTTEIARIEVPGGWETHRVGSVTLPRGRKRMLVRYEGGGDAEGEAPFVLQALMLAERPAQPDATAPHVTLHHPPEGLAVHGADAVVADATDDVGLGRAELLVDGVATGQAIDLALRPGRVVFPLLARGLAPGPHVVAVRVTDAAGNVTVSAPRTVDVLAAAPPGLTTYERAVRLLDRFAYGADQRELAAILTAGADAWLDAALHRPFDDPGELAALGAGFPRHPGLRPGDVTGRTLSHLLRTPNPARARFVLWAENHFSTWIRKIGGEAKWAEHVTFARLGPAPFERLLFTSAESPAMLAYLDQVQSYAGRLNENYAREIMELHTLGVDGGYHQSDVTNLAHLLTGWTASLDGDGRSGGAAARRSTFRFDPALNDGAGTHVFGVDFPAADAPARFDRAVLAIEHLASHPVTARFIARKLAAHYVGAPPPEEIVDELAAVFLASGGDMTAMLGAIARSPVFDTPRPPERIAQPIDYVVRLFRVSGHVDAARAERFLQTSGQGLFDRATPDGYPEEGAAYVDTNALLQRWKLARDATGPLIALVPPAWRAPGADGDPAWAQSVVDVIAVRLTGRILSDASNAAALELLAAAEGPPAARIGVLAPFIAQLPEANLR